MTIQYYTDKHDINALTAFLDKWLKEAEIIEGDNEIIIMPTSIMPEGSIEAWESSGKKIGKLLLNLIKSKILEAIAEYENE